SRVCPLAPLENHWRALGGGAGYSGGFLAHYLGALLYPVGLTAHIQMLLATILIAVNLLAHAGLLLRNPRRRDYRQRSPCPENECPDPHASHEPPGNAGAGLG